jgi:hypothetical protein
LRSGIALRLVKVESGDGALTGGAFEYGDSPPEFDGVRHETENRRQIFLSLVPSITPKLLSFLPSLSSTLGLSVVFYAVRNL